MTMRTRPLLPLLMLATASALSCTVWVAPSPTAPSAVAMAPAANATAANAPAVDPALAVVQAQLERYARRTGLTGAEIATLARTLVEEARRHRLDPQLVLAVVHVESRYDTYAVSDKNAMGLMQILPSTGEWLAARLDVPWQGPQMLFDPVVNVRLGVAYLRQLLDRYDGNLPAALAAYNWGPGHIDGRLRDGTPLPVDYKDLVLRAYDRHTQRS
jgi:soluble lytic murein transglycosylase-like protein